jgi:hypothetical protein
MRAPAISDTRLGEESKNKGEAKEEVVEGVEDSVDEIIVSVGACGRIGKTRAVAQPG